MKILLIAIFGMLGVLSRYFIDSNFAIKNTPFPFSTLLANLIGCFLAGLIYTAIQSKYQNNIYLLPMLIGFCGGLTTFSSYALQSFNLFSSHPFKAFLYVGGSPILGMLAIYLGVKSFILFKY